MVPLVVWRVLGVNRAGIFEMFRPGQLDKNGHENAGEDGIGRMIRQADRQEAKDQGFDLPPVPPVLVKNIYRQDQGGDE